jgi:hypothetical protein
MPVQPQHLLAGIVLASGIGALAMCLLVLRYGFASAPEDAGDARRREMATRLGHALAGACFAVAAMLAVVLVSHWPPGPAASADVVAPEHDGVERAMTVRVAEVAERLAALESRMEAMESRVAPLDGRVADTRERLGAVVARVERAALEGRVQEIETRLDPLERRLARAEPAGDGAAATRLERAEARVQALESRVRQQTDELARATARLKQLEEAPASLPARPAPTPPSTPERPRVVEPAPGGARWIPPAEAPAPARGGAVSPPAASPRPGAALAPGEAAVARRPEPPGDAGTPARAGSPGTGPPDAAGGRPTDRSAGAGTQLGERIREDWQTVRRGFEDAGDDLRRAVDSLRRNLRETFGQ